MSTISLPIPARWSVVPTRSNMWVVDASLNAQALITYQPDYAVRDYGWPRFTVTLFSDDDALGDMRGAETISGVEHILREWEATLSR